MHKTSKNLNKFVINLLVPYPARITLNEISTFLTFSGFSCCFAYYDLIWIVAWVHLRRSALIY